MRHQATGRNNRPDLKSEEAYQHLVAIQNHLTTGYGNEVSENILLKINDKLGIDVKGELQSYLIKKTMNRLFQSQLPFKIANCSFHLFRTGLFHLKSGFDKGNIYSPKLDPDMYVDYLIWTWQNNKEPQYMGQF